MSDFALGWRKKKEGCYESKAEVNGMPRCLIENVLLPVSRKGWRVYYLLPGGNYERWIPKEPLCGYNMDTGLFKTLSSAKEAIYRAQLEQLL